MHVREDRSKSKPKPKTIYIFSIALVGKDSMGQLSYNVVSIYRSLRSNARIIICGRIVLVMILM